MVRKIGTNKTQILQRMRLRNLHPNNQYLTYQSQHANGNQTRKSPLNTMTNTPEHGSVNMTRQYSTVIATICYHLIHLKSQFDLEKQLMKRGVLQEPYKRTTQTFSPTRTKWVTEPIRITTCSLMRIIA